jgi:hypothetical protein
MSHVMTACTTIIMRHFAPIVSIIADGIGSVLPRCATTTDRCSQPSVATARNVHLISNDRRCEHVPSSPQARNHAIEHCYLEQFP